MLLNLELKASGELVLFRDFFWAIFWISVHFVVYSSDNSLQSLLVPHFSRIDRLWAT